MEQNKLLLLEKELFTAFLLDNPDIEPRQTLFEECSLIFQKKTKNMPDEDLNSMSVRIHDRLNRHSPQQQKSILEKVIKY